MPAASQDSLASQDSVRNEGVEIMPGKGVEIMPGKGVEIMPGKGDQPENGLLKRMVIVGGLFVVLMIAVCIGTTMGAVIFANKDMHVRQDGSQHPMATDGNGNVLQMGPVATYPVPLYAATVLPDEVLFKVDELRVTLPNTEFDENAVNSFRISRVEKVNSTVVVFYAVGGEQVRVVNGRSVRHGGYPRNCRGSV